MDNTVFVGDIHGDLEFVQFIDKQYKTWKKVFVGDYLDSLYHSPDHCIKAIQYVLMMTERGDTQALLGNHEISYLFPGNRCSGWNRIIDIQLIHLQNWIHKKFLWYLWIPEHKIFVTHAGLTRYLWNDATLTFDNLFETLDQWKRQDLRISKFGWIGKARGGIDPFGGPFWCDFEKEFQPIEGLIQIFGHTPGETIRQVGSNYNINQFEMMAVREVLEFVEGQFQIAKYQTINFGVFEKI